MASGLVALLDDVAAIAKIAATSLDDVGAAASKAGVKAAGVVIDDAAVTPGYAVGFTPDRELPIVFKIAMGSLRNKFLFLLPGALVLSAAAPWAVTPLLMLGGCFLCYEAAEKIAEALLHHDEADELDELALSSEELEKEKVSGAIRTDMILSAEIMAIALNDVTNQPLALQAAALAVVSLGITIGVYGVVALIVKMDDIGLHLSERRNAGARVLGRGLVKAMPVVLDLLTKVGTAAMLWVGGGILVHGLEHFHVPVVPQLVERFSHWAGAFPGVGPITGWLAFALGSAALGLIVGAVIVGVMHLIPKRKKADV
jgi:predicted DNA repair protein MutK